MDAISCPSANFLFKVLPAFGYIVIEEDLAEISRFAERPFNRLEPDIHSRKARLVAEVMSTLIRTCMCGNKDGLDMPVIIMILIKTLPIGLPSGNKSPMRAFKIRKTQKNLNIICGSNKFTLKI